MHQVQAFRSRTVQYLSLWSPGKCKTHTHTNTFKFCFLWYPVTLCSSSFVGNHHHYINFCAILMCYLTVSILPGERLTQWHWADRKRVIHSQIGDKLVYFTRAISMCTHKTEMQQIGRKLTVTTTNYYYHHMNTCWAPQLEMNPKRFTMATTSSAILCLWAGPLHSSHMQ